MTDHEPRCDCKDCQPDPPIGTAVEVSFQWGGWAAGVVTARDPFGFTVTFEGGHSCHSGNDQMRWRLPLPPPPPPSCEVCSTTLEDLCDVYFPGSGIAGEASVTVRMCPSCAGAAHPAGVVLRARPRWS